jgi:1-acyl-sn-glycerol-3-phosphate acyltransferase
VTRLAHLVLRLAGWEFRGAVPDIPKMVIVGAPHTTNWDFVLFLGALRAYRMRARFIGKHTLFRWPFGHFFRALGGIPVDRGRPGGVVLQVAEAFAREERMVLVIAPEGTRQPAPYWKSGFLGIAEEAGVPIVLAAVDYPRKEVTIGPVLHYDGDAGRFMAQARAFYEGKVGLHPAGGGPVMVREELRG